MLSMGLPWHGSVDGLTLACSLILSSIDYCNTVLYGALIGTIQKL